MKLRYLLTGATLIVSLLAVTAITVLAVAPKGRFRTVNSTTISGWAYNSSAPDDALNARISIKDRNTGEGVFSQRMTAGEHSDELYGSGKGNGCRAFVLNMDRSVLSYGVYLVEGYVGDGDPSNPRTHTSDNPNTRREAPAAEAQNLVPLGVFKTAGYYPRGTCSGGWGRRTSIGAVATADHTIAADPRAIPYGSRVMVNGVVHTTEDRGEAVRGSHTDVLFNTHAETRQHGTQNAEVYLAQS